MKKYAILTMAMVLALALCACGGTAETTAAPATEAPTTKPAAPAYPDNPPTGDEMVPCRILLTMGICCLLLGLSVKEKDRP